MVFLLFVFILISHCFSHRPKEYYAESLLIRRLDSDSIGFRFEFISRKDKTHQLNQFEIFPKLIAQLITLNVTRVRLSMTRGKWEWTSETLYPSVESAAPGIELWADLVSIENDWVPLIRSLAGMTCASLDVLEKKSLSGRLTKNIIFAAMPSETLCTENISTWLKLLPCRSKSGLGSLISAKKFLLSEYYSLSWSINQNKFGFEFIQSLTVVLPFNPKSTTMFSIGQILGINKPFLSSCQVAVDSKIFIEKEEDITFFTTPKSDTQDPLFLAWNLPLAEGDISFQTDLPVYQGSTREIKTSKWYSGVGDIRGTITTALYNSNPHNDLHVHHLEIIPSFLRPKFSTFKITYKGQDYFSPEKLKSMIKITPTLLRDHYCTLELDLWLPKGNDPLLVKYSFDKAFLYFDEYPSDPNRGHDVPASITSYNRSNEVKSKLPGILLRTKTGPVHIATQALLITLAHPDFSMPYNVITLSSTGFALFLGMIVNASVRRRGDRWVPKRKSFFETLSEKCKRKQL